MPTECDNSAERCTGLSSESGCTLRFDRLAAGHRRDVTLHVMADAHRPCRQRGVGNGENDREWQINQAAQIGNTDLTGSGTRQGS